MDVSGVGAGPPAADFDGALGAVARTAPLSGTAQSAGDLFVSVLQELSEAEMTTLLNMIERPESPQQAGRLDDLLRAAVAAAAEGDGNRAISALEEFAVISPRRAETLESLPSLSAIRGLVERLVSRLSATAKGDAEARLGQAVKLVESAGARELVVREIRAENLILIAGRLLDAGGYANSVWSAELSQLVIDPRLWAPVAVPAPPPVKDSGDRRTAAGGGIVAAIRLACASLELKSRLRRVWLRAPLLVLLLGWFAVGLAAGVFSALVQYCWPRLLPAALVAGSFEVWALGFLILVAAAFYLSARNVRF